MIALAFVVLVPKQNEQTNATWALTPKGFRQCFHQKRFKIAMSSIVG